MGSAAAALLLAALGASWAAPSATHATEPSREPGTMAPRHAPADRAPVDPFATPPRSDGTAPRVVAPPRAAPPPRTPAAAPTTATARAPLRDPFAGAPRTPGTRPISADLKDPFANPDGGRGVPLRPIRDLRDPFVPRPDGLRPGQCVTPSGVPVQRPKGMPPAKRCPGHDAPLRNPFALPA